MSKNNPKQSVETLTLLDRVSTSWDGALLECYPSNRPTFTMQKITIPPRTKMDPHSHKVMQLGYILSGELTITTEDGSTTSFQAGDPAIETVGKIHYGENRLDVDCVVLVITIL